MKWIIRRYELTDAEWKRLQPYFPERQMGDKGRPSMMTHFTMLQRNLLYTGVTRAKKTLVLVGQKKAIPNLSNIPPKLIQYTPELRRIMACRLSEN